MQIKFAMILKSLKIEPICPQAASAGWEGEKNIILPHLANQ